MLLNCFAYFLLNQWNCYVRWYEWRIMHAQDSSCIKLNIYGFRQTHASICCVSLIYIFFTYLSTTWAFLVEEIYGLPIEFRALWVLIGVSFLLCLAGQCVHFFCVSWHVRDVSLVRMCDFWEIVEMEVSSFWPTPHVEVTTGRVPQRMESLWSFGLQTSKIIKFGNRHLNFSVDETTLSIGAISSLFKSPGICLMQCSLDSWHPSASA